MALEVDFLQLRTSWTKYDIVRVMEVTESLEILDKFKSKEAKIDEPILRSFLGIKSLKDPTPSYWIDIQKYPSEKKLFSLLAILFTHGEIISEFAQKFSTENMKGIFKLEAGKQYTNIRSALIESGASTFIYRKKPNVPYDFSTILQNGDVGKLFKKVLIERISRLVQESVSDSDFYEVCFSNNFHKALSISKEQFKSWLEGTIDFKSSFIKSVQISNFFSIEEVILDFNNSKEVYFLGENGDGKSLLLMAIYLAFNGNYIIEKTDQEKTGKATDIIRNNPDIQLSGVDDRGIEHSLRMNTRLNNIFAYGTHRGRISTDNPEQYGFMSLFDTEETLLNPVSWLKDQKLLENVKTDVTNPVQELKMQTNLFSISFLEKMFFDLLEKHVEIRVEGNEVNFIEKGTSLKFEQLSEGYKSILIFVCDLLYRLNKNKTGEKSYTEFKGVVLVDEIDLHLHPKWQRVIVRKLRRLLPHVQFIFTTHSPTIIQGASDDAIIHRVYRNTEDGKTRISDPYFRKNLDHLMINTILTSPLFGLNDARMNAENDNADTSSTYLLYRINKKLEKVLESQKAEGKEFIRDEDIDSLIQKIIDSEIKKDD